MSGLAVIPPDTVRQENKVDDLSTIQPSTNSYGEFLPIGYGSARLPGHLIWAAPIREEVTSESVNIGKKSKKSYNETIERYSYFATFIYAYAIGPAEGIGKAWVNNIQLDQLEDAGIEFEVYLGTADQQPPDIPLMPGQINLAYKDIVYIVFRDILLTPFNNRIPTIDVEVVFSGSNVCEYTETFSEHFEGAFTALESAASMFVAYDVRRILLATNKGILAVLNLDTLETIFTVDSNRTIFFNNQGHESYFVPTTIGGRFAHGYFSPELTSQITQEGRGRVFKFDLLSGVISRSSFPAKIPPGPLGFDLIERCGRESQEFFRPSNAVGLAGFGHAGVYTDNIIVTFADKRLALQPTLFNTNVALYTCIINGWWLPNPAVLDLNKTRLGPYYPSLSTGLFISNQGSGTAVELAGGTRQIAPVGYKVRAYEAIFFGAISGVAIALGGIGYTQNIYATYGIDLGIVDILNKAAEYPTIEDHPAHNALITSTEPKGFTRTPILFLDLVITKLYMCVTIETVSFFVKFSFNIPDENTDPELVVEYVAPIPVPFNNTQNFAFGSHLNIPLPQNNTQAMNWLPVADDSNIWFIYTPTGRYRECELTGYRTEQGNRPHIFWDAQLKELNIIEESMQDVMGTPTEHIRLKRARFTNIGGASGARVPISGIIQDLCLKAGLTMDDIDVSEVTETVQGYFINAFQSASRSIEELAEVFNINISEVDDRLVFIPNNTQTSLVNVDKDKVALDPILTVHSDHEVPSTYELQYFNHEAAYQPNVIASKRPVNPVGVVNNEQTSNTSINLIEDATRAKRIANRKLYSIWAERDIIKTKLPLAHLPLSVSDRINLEIDELGFTKSRIINYDVGADLSVDIEAVIEERASAPLVDNVPIQYTLDNVSGTSGTSILPTINNLESQAIKLILLDVPYIRVNRPVAFDENVTLLAGIQVFSDLFLGCTLSMSVDGGESFVEQTRFNKAQSITYGVMTSTLNAPVSKDRWDYENSIDIKVIKGMENFETITELQTLLGDNILLVSHENGTEIVFFQNVEFTGTDTVRLTKLLRGRNGTDTNIVDSLAGAEVYLYSNQTFKYLHVPTTLIEKEVIFRVATYSLTGTDVVDIVIQANSLRPWSVAHAMIDNNILSWVRRTRHSGELNDYVGEVPVNETRELYRVTLKQTLEADNEFTYNIEPTIEEAAMYRIMFPIPESFVDTDFFYMVQQVSSLGNLGFGTFSEYISTVFRINLEFMGNILATAMSERYTIEVREDAIVLATLTNVSASTLSAANIRLRLFNADTNSEIAQNEVWSQNGAGRISFSLPVGTYYYIVIGENGEVNADFTLDILTPEIIAMEDLGGDPIVKTENVTFRTVYYQYISVDSDTVVIATLTDVAESGEAGNIRLNLYNADTNDLINQNEVWEQNGAAHVSRNLAAGTYYYLVEGEHVNANTGSTLTIQEPEIEALSGTVTEMGSVTFKTLYYKYISLDAAATVTAVLDNISASGDAGDLRFSLFDSNNNIIGSTAFNKSDMLQAGVYYYLVEGRVAESNTNFRLTLTRS